MSYLATLAEEWFERRPESASSLAVQIGQIRTGCVRLILDDHKQLDELDREWLRKRCRVWSSEFRDQLDVLERSIILEGSDIDLISIVRDQADETVRTLIRLLKERAQQIAARSA